MRVLVWPSEAAPALWFAVPMRQHSEAPSWAAGLMRGEAGGYALRDPNSTNWTKELTSAIAAAVRWAQAPYTDLPRGWRSPEFQELSRTDVIIAGSGGAAGKQFETG